MRPLKIVKNNKRTTKQSDRGRRLLSTILRIKSKVVKAISICPCLPLQTYLVTFHLELSASATKNTDHQQWAEPVRLWSGGSLLPITRDSVPSSSFPLVSHFHMDACPRLPGVDRGRCLHSTFPRET